MVAAGVAVLGLGQIKAHAASNVLFILDGSGSMWAKVEGRAKIDVAKEVLGGLLSDLPSDTRVGLVAYGHTKKDDCKDVQVLAPLRGRLRSRGGLGKRGHRGARSAVQEGATLPGGGPCGQRGAGPSWATSAPGSP